MGKRVNKKKIKFTFKTKLIAFYIIDRSWHKGYHIYFCGVWFISNNKYNIYS